MFDFSNKNTKISLLENRIVELENKVTELENKLNELTHLKKNNDSQVTTKSLSKKDSEKENLYQKQVKKTLKAVMEATGWDYNYAETKYQDAHNRTACTPKEYLMYKFYELSDAEQESFYLVCYQKILHAKYESSRKFTKLIRDKEKTNIFFAEYVKRPWCTNTKVSFKDFKEIFKDSSRLIYKPIDGHCGYGVEAFDINSNNIETVYNKLTSLPEGVIEQFITQHKDMNELCPSCINSLRFVTISSNKKPVSADGNKIEFVYSIVRMGKGNSIVDNLHSGGMVANVDMETGVLITNASDHERNIYINHPATGTPIKGFKVPYFFEALEMVRTAIETKQVEGYLGWDIAISENGPMLLEVNNRPGADGLQAAFAPERKGMKYVMDKFLQY